MIKTTYSLSSVGPIVIIHLQFGFPGFSQKNSCITIVESIKACLILTGVSYEKGKLGIAVYDSNAGDTFYYFQDAIPHNFHGTGDVYSSCVAGGLSIGLSIEEASSLAVDFTVDAMKKSYDERDEHWYGVYFERSLAYLCERVGSLKK